MADERKQLHDMVDRALKRGDMAEAASAYRRLVALNPNDQALLQRLADMQARAGQETEARDTFLRLAEEYWKAGYAQRGLAALRRASKLGGADPTILSLLGQRLLETGLVADARDPLLDAARLWEQKGNRVQAGSLFSQVAELLPKDLPSREGLARLADKSGTPAERAAARVQLALARLRGGDLATALR
ncbi:MAG: tetratricopeptide repeat protein, partial [Candidatus Polarisedimenticolia bacterium]